MATETSSHSSESSDASDFEATAAASAASSALPSNLKLDKRGLTVLSAGPPVKQAPLALTSVPALPSKLDPVILPVYRAFVDGRAPEPTNDAVTFEPSVWQVPLRPDIIHTCVVYQDKKERRTLYMRKTRAEVRGGGRKPWRQKGTGRARHGSTRSPLWRGGGIAHAPRLRDWSIGINKKVKVLGMKVALSAKLRDKRVVVVVEQGLFSIKGKTNKLSTLVNSIAPSKSPKIANTPTVIITTDPTAKLHRSADNLDNVKILNPTVATVKDIVGAQVLIVTPGAVEALNARLRKYD